MEQQKPSKPWFKKWWGILLIVIFFPILVPYLVWTATSWNKIAKVGISLVCLFIIFMSFSSSEEAKNQALELTDQAEAYINEGKIEEALEAISQSKSLFSDREQNNKENVIEASDKEESEEKVESKETLKEEQKADSIEVNENPQEANLPNEQSIVSGNLEVHFIDVGQADSILVKAPAGTMLIDAGNNTDSDLVTSYIKKQGIIKLDVVVGTHPHEDHIGGLDAVITAFDIEKVYMPKVAHTTQTFEDVLLAIQNKGLKITAPTPGATFDVGGAKCTILAPNSNSYDDLNNYSIVIKMEYGQTSFLFAGDAEDVSEKEMLNKKNDLSSHVLKVGHHGSDSSTTQAFLNAVNPKYAVIMVGKNNSYGHPTKTVLDRLKAKGVAVYRTDENGTIVATSDGSNIKFSTRPGTYSGSSGGSSGSIAPAAPAPEAKVSDTPVPTATDSDRIVYWTPGGKSYHYNKNCSTLSRSKNILEGPLSECPKNDPCDRCVR